MLTEGKRDEVGCPKSIPCLRCGIGCTWLHGDEFKEPLDHRRCEEVEAGTLVDQTEGVGLAHFEQFAREALDVGDRDIRFWSPLISSVRRLRGPVRGGISCEDASQTESFLDRPEAIVAIASAVHLPVMSSLVNSAYELLGYVIRDADVVEDWIDQAGDGDTQVRSVLAVALGLLGRVPPLHVAWANPVDIEQGVAYCASLAIGAQDQGERMMLSEEAEVYAEGPSIEVAERAVGRIASGCRLSVLD